MRSRDKDHGQGAWDEEHGMDKEQGQGARGNIVVIYIRTIL